jgi:hypothetical protein
MNCRNTAGINHLAADTNPRGVVLLILRDKIDNDLQDTCATDIDLIVGHRLAHNLEVDVSIYRAAY